MFEVLKQPLESRVFFNCNIDQSANVTKFIVLVIVGYRKLFLEQKGIYHLR
jgi:hypothetical protein